MAKITLLLDEDVRPILGEILRQRGYDAVHRAIGARSCNPTFHLASVSTCDSGVIKSICSTGQDGLNPPT